MSTYLLESGPRLDACYDPDANRIEWLWQVSRRFITHNHQRRDFDLLREDVKAHFQALIQTPAALLCHIGGPFALEGSALRRELRSRKVDNRGTIPLSAEFLRR